MKRTLQLKRKRECFARILKMNDFERRWIKSVRYELCFQEQIGKIFETLRLHVKYSIIRRNMARKQCCTFLRECKEMADRTNLKLTTLRKRFGKRSQRQILKVLRQRVLYKQKKRYNRQRMAEFRQLQLHKLGFRSIANLKKFNDEVRNDMILSKALTNETDFFQVQIRKENRMQNDQDLHPTGLGEFNF